MSTVIFQNMGNSVMKATDALVIPASTGLINDLQPMASIGVTIYLFCMFAMMVLGMVQTPLGKVLTVVGKIAIVAAFFEVSNYHQYVVGGFTALQSGLIEALGLSGGDMYGVLDNTLATGMDLVIQCLNNSDDAGLFTSPGSMFMWFFCGCIVAAGVGFVCLVGFAAIVLSQFSLSIMFAIGPFFIMLAFFPMTSRFFEGWFSTVMNYVLLGVIASVMMSFAIAAISAYMGVADLSGDGEVNPVMVTAEVFVMTCVLAFGIYTAASMAASLAGGLSMATITLAHIVRAAKAPYSILNPQQVKRDGKSGLLTQASRAEHWGSGNTWANPKWAQQQLNNFFGRGGSTSNGGGWGKWQGGNARVNT